MKPNRALAGLVTLCALQASCADGDETLQILHNKVPDEGCVVSASETEVFFPRGIIDTNARTGYLFTPLVENLAEAREGANRDVQIRGADVDLEFEGTLGDGIDSALTHYRETFSGSIRAGGLGGYAFIVIPKAVLDTLGTKLGEGGRTQVLAKVKILGDIAGGSVTSNVFNYPIDVCNGCLQNVAGDCSALSPSFEVRQGGICQPLQDGSVDCCTRNDALVCPADPPAAAE